MTDVARPERFRILIIGRANAGKTTILRAVCGVDEEPEVYDRRGNKITPVVHHEETPDVGRVGEAVSEIHEVHHPEAASAFPNSPHLEQGVHEASEGHPMDGEANQVTRVSTRSVIRSAWRSICARIMCRAPDSMLTAHLEEPGEFSSAPSPLASGAPGSIRATHREEPEEISSAPSPPVRSEPKSIISPSSLRGEHNIEYELRFPGNPGFVFHDSRGFESGSVEELDLVRKFIQEQASLGSMSKQLHAIWYCFPADSNRLMTAAEQEFFNKIDTGSVPVIAVFTKFDALDSAAFTELCSQGFPFETAKEMAPKHAKETFNKEFLPLVESLAHQPKAVVHLRNMHDRKSLTAVQEAASELVQSTEAALDSDVLKMLLVQAQRVNVELCIKSAVRNEPIMDAAEGALRVNPTKFNPLEKSLIVGIFDWFPSIWAWAFHAFITHLKPLFSPLAPSLAPPLQVLFVGITAVIIAADSLWPTSGNSGRQQIATSLAHYFQSGRADCVRMALLEALHSSGGPSAHLSTASLEHIALNNYQSSGSVPMLSNVA
ncbi:hypothetical protein BOTBODRAFT_34030 [Botryobasidium botryosum FD-172 SS1]|uniref:G domain-containing protein n=1 Tax=Botryobasidium botryosum (strain FD-172 SS1) TaxID=930990 RepID=A0A067MBG3_BOTB1|nr:hypothetical protein BOTBODRAFT_34030 [Botryobasidium botryosum FD-172 SS1]